MRVRLAASIAALAAAALVAAPLAPGYKVDTFTVPPPAGWTADASGLERVPLAPRIAPDHAGGFFFMDPLAFVIRHHDPSGKVVGSHAHERAKTIIFNGRRFVAQDARTLVLRTLPRELVRFDLTSGQVEYFHGEEKLKGAFESLAVDAAGRVFASFREQSGPGRFRPHVRLLARTGESLARLDGILATGFAVAPDGLLVGVSLEDPKLTLVAFDPSGKPLGQLPVPEGDRQSEVLAITPRGQVLLQTGGEPREITWPLAGRNLTVRTGVRPDGLLEPDAAGRLFVLRPPTGPGASLVVERHQVVAAPGR
jgi:hypothetical protein